MDNHRRFYERVNQLLTNFGKHHQSASLLEVGRLRIDDCDDYFNVSFAGEMIVYHQKTGYRKATTWGSEKAVEATLAELDRLLILDDLSAI